MSASESSSSSPSPEPSPGTSPSPPSSRGGEPASGSAGPTAAGRAVAGALLAASAAFLSVLCFSAWLGALLGLADAPGLRFTVEGEITGAVRFLSVLLEGVSGVYLASAASALLLALALGVGAGDGRPILRAVRGRLGELRRDFGRLSRDAARWARELPRREGGRHAAVLAAVVLGGLALRLLYLSQPVRYDEAFTFTHFAARAPELGLSRYTYPNNHLLHTLLVHLTTSAFGSAPEVMRLPAFLAGVAAVPAAYAAWDALGDAGEALAAAAVAAVAAPLVLYSTNARGYSIVLLLGLLLVPLAARLLRRRDRAAWALFWMTSAAALHAVPVAVYPVGAALAWLVLSGRGGGDDGAREAAGGGPRGPRDRPAGRAEGGAVAADSRRPRAELLRESALAAAAVAVAAAWLYMPAVQRSGVPAIVANRFVSPSPVGEFLAGLPGFLADVWATWTAGWPVPVAAGLGVLALLGAARDLGVGGRPGGLGGAEPTGIGGAGSTAGATAGEGRGERVARRPSPVSYPLVAVGWSLLVLLAGRRVSFARIWLFLLPVCGLLAARGLGWAAAWLRRFGRRLGASGEASRAASATASATVGGLGSRVAGPAAAALLLAGLGGSVAATGAVTESPATGPYRDGEEAARLLRERMEEGDAVMASGPPEVVLEYWFRHLGMPGDLLNVAPDPGGRLFVVVHRAEGQTLPEMMARAGVAGSRRIRTEEVAELEHSDLHVLLPPE